MTVTEFKRLTKLAREQAERVMIGTKEELLSTFLLVKRDGGCDIIGCPWQNDEQKREMVLGVCLEALKVDAVAFSFSTECWFATVKNEGDQLPPPLGPRPSDRPDRKESVLALVGDESETKLSTWDIIRDEAGRCIELRKAVYEVEGFSSWITRALQRAVLLNNKFPGAERRENIVNFLKKFGL
jgi:hypothetical protein